jgi:hypothetical protein
VRYKVTADSDGKYRDLVDLLQGSVKLYAVSPKRRLLATEDLSGEIKDAIRERGGEIREDPTYDLE